MGVPAGVQQVATTTPYYRSSYVWVSQRARATAHPLVRRSRFSHRSGSACSSVGTTPARRRRRPSDVAGLPPGIWSGLSACGDERGSSPPSSNRRAPLPAGRSTSPRCGDRSPATTPRGNRCRSSCARSPRRSTAGCPRCSTLRWPTRRDDARRLDQLNRFIATHQRDIDALLDRYHVPTSGACVMNRWIAVVLTLVCCARVQARGTALADAAGCLEAVADAGAVRHPSGWLAPPPPTVSPFQDNAYGISEGKRLFESFNCVGCHSHGGGGMGPALMDDRWIYGSRPENIYATILEGRPNGMPSFGAARLPTVRSGNWSPSSSR